MMNRKELYESMMQLANTIWWYSDLSEREWSGNSADTCIELILRLHGVNDKTLGDMGLDPSKADFFQNKSQICEGKRNE